MKVLTPDRFKNENSKKKIITTEHISSNLVEMWCRSWSVMNAGFNILTLFPGNNSWISMNTIWHMKGTDIYECVEFGAAWLNLRGMLALGRGMCPTEGHSSLFMWLITLCLWTGSTDVPGYTFLWIYGDMMKESVFVFDVCTDICTWQFVVLFWCYGGINQLFRDCCHILLWDTKNIRLLLIS